MVSRPDGRGVTELRPVEIIRGYTAHAPGSVLIASGQTKVLVTASIEERVPRHIKEEKEDGHGWITAEYSMLPSATHTRSNRERFKVSGRTMEIQRLIGRCLRASVDMGRLGTRTITIDADVIQADGGTRVTAITGGYIALVDAMNHLKEEGLLEELPIISPIAAISVGVVEDDVFVDLNYAEDFQATVDANVIMNGNGDLIEFQASSEGLPFSRATLDKMVDGAAQGIQQLIQLQQTALEQPLPSLVTV